MKLDSLIWEGKDYSDQLKFIANGYYNIENKKDTVYFQDLRFGTVSHLNRRGKAEYSI